MIISFQKNSALLFSFDEAKAKRSKKEKTINSWIEKIETGIFLKTANLELENVFSAIEKEMALADPTLSNSVKAELQRTKKGINHLEEKWTRAVKRRNEISINQISKIYNQIFPEGEFQERHDSLWSYMVKYGIEILDNWLESSNPFNDELTILREQSKIE